ncbi:restriction endonuclease subunit S [Ketobacter sp.]
MSWPVVRLGDIFEREVGGISFSRDQFSESGIPVVPKKAISSDVQIDNSNLVYTPPNIAEKYAQYSVDNSFLITTLRDLVPTGPNLGRICEINAPHDFLLAQGVYAFKLCGKVHPKYLCYFSNSNLFRKQVLQAKVGSTQVHIRSSEFKAVEIPLPPLPEQKRIAAILDKADAIRRKRQQAIQLTDEFLRAVFLDMFGDPVTNPKGWEVKPLAFGIESITSGWSAKGESYPCKSGELGVLKISSVTSGKFNPQENKLVHGDSIPEGKCLVFPRKGDLLFSRANTRELVAATCIVPKDQHSVFLPDKLWKVKTNANFLLPEFLNYLIWEPKFKEKLTSQATGTSGSMLNISKGKLEATDAIFPDLSLQNKFGSIFWTIQKTLTSLKESRDGLDIVFSSLSQKSFSGEL